MGQTFICVDNVWRPCSSSIVKVTYNSSYGTAPAQEITLSSILVTIPGCGTRIGYDFIGWSVVNGSSNAEYVTGSKYYFTKNTTLYAVWKVQTFTLTRYRNGSVYSTSVANYGQSIAAGSCTDYDTTTTFAGWTDNNTTPIVKYNGSTELLMTSNKSLYAVFNSSVYTTKNYTGSPNLVCTIESSHAGISSAELSSSVNCECDIVIDGTTSSNVSLSASSSMGINIQLGSSVSIVGRKDGGDITPSLTLRVIYSDSAYVFSKV